MYSRRTFMKVQVILGSTREGRFSEKPGGWIVDELKKRDGIEAEVLDLRDYPMPFFNEPVSPSVITEPYKNEAVQRWTRKIDEGDGYVIIAPEYNHGYPAVLKNALDYTYKSWNRKAVGFVGYGSAMGARSIEQLRLVVAELQMVSVRQSVLIPGAVYMEAKNASSDGAVKTAFEPVSEQAKTMIDQLLWWAGALKNAREQTS